MADEMSANGTMETQQMRTREEREIISTLDEKEKTMTTALALDRASPN